MARSDKEVKEKVEELKRGFDRVRDLAEANQEQFYAKTGYLTKLGQQVVNVSGKRIKNAVPLPGSETVRTAAWHLEGIIRQSLTFHVEGRADEQDNRRNAKRTDAKELFWGNTWGVKFDFVGTLQPDICNWQVQGPFAALWLDYVAHAPPKDAEAAKKYEQTYFPASLRVVNGLTAFFTESDKEPFLATAAALEYEQSYIEVIERYSDKYDGKNALRICQEEFPYLRGGHASPTDITVDDLTSKKAKVCVFDDGNEICHYIDIGTEQGGQRRYNEVASYKNPWGCCSLFIIPGVYNPAAIDIEDRYRGLVDALLESQHKIDEVKTFHASIDFTPPQPTATPSDQMMEQAIAEGLPETDAGDLMLVPGQLGSIDFTLNPGIDTILDHLLKDREYVMPPAFLTNPDQQVAAYANTSVALQANETSNRSFDNARLYVIKAIQRISKAIEHCICYHTNKPGQSRDMDTDIYFTPRGDEPTKLFAGTYKWQPMYVSPKDFEHDDVLFIENVPQSQAQKMMRYQERAQQAAAGHVPQSWVLETITENVTGLQKELEKEAAWQLYRPMIYKGYVLKMVERIRAATADPATGMGGLDLSFMLMPLMQASEPAPTNGASPPRERQGTVVQTAAAPIQNSNDLGLRG